MAENTQTAKLRVMEEANFRELYHRYQYIECPEDMDALKNSFTVMEGATGILTYCYIEEGLGLSFYILCSAKMDGTELEAGPDVTAQMDFVKDGKSGMYVLQKDDAVFSLPNQKLPFLREDFYVKNAYADFVIDGTEIEITVYEGMTFHIELNHYRSLEGVIGKDGSAMIEENTLNRKEQQFYDRHDEEINGTLKQLVEIYEAVY